MGHTYDPFTRADSNALGSTPEGYAWTEPLGSHAINSNALYHDDTADGCALINVGDPNQNCWAIIGAADNTGLIARAGSTALDGYQVFEFAGTTSQLFRQVAGSFTQLGANAAGIANNDKFGINVQGSTIEMLKNGTVIRSATDSNITTGNYCGPFSGSVFGRTYLDFDATFGSAATVTPGEPTVLSQAVHRASRW